VRCLELVAQPIALALQAIPLPLQPVAVVLHRGFLALQPRDLAQQLLARLLREPPPPHHIVKKAYPEPQIYNAPRRAALNEYR